ncbi:hypothetical protein ARALYDRAFT_898993 [Arabidopsis lyrata subsp. lyrata]|uniref:Late embryogenesis abundant domain-containing protein n=1 Tax=Arabidopsis lyrata subsp. lyrata TaxID=81972 RepID=D7L4C7_ARALL|nr:hypothetical protein ARALYDRAFT_898993 [Arabidopsis lyrata subsp. lyrata]
MSNLQQAYNAGQTKGQAHIWPLQEKAEQWTESAKETAHSARDKTANAAQSTKESAQHGQQQASGFIQQTGESVKNMAQGAVDGVKNTLGINEKK